MTAKQYLRQILKAERNIKILEEEIEERRTKLESTAAPSLGDKVQTSPGGDRFAEMVANLADKEIQQAELVYIYKDMRITMVNQIIGLDNDMQVAVLRGRYIQGKSLRMIAWEQHYSYDRICHVHGEALTAFAKKYPECLID